MHDQARETGTVTIPNGKFSLQDTATAVAARDCAPMSGHSCEGLPGLS